MPTLRDLKIGIYADGASTEEITRLHDDPIIKGFTTNPTLMRSAGVQDYEEFGLAMAAAAGDKPISFEVIADDLEGIERQALRIASWPGPVYAKIPVTTTDGTSTAPVVSALAARGVRLNVTALLTIPQVREMSEALAGVTEAFISVFAGRIADTGQDPIPVMCHALEIMRSHSNLRLIWASPRELLNLVQADAIGCHVITMTQDLLKKLPLLGRDLSEFSLDTVKMFHNDGMAAGLEL